MSILSKAKQGLLIWLRKLLSQLSKQLSLLVNMNQLVVVVL
jgi:hypothetical protein